VAPGWTALGQPEVQQDQVGASAADERQRLFDGARLARAPETWLALDDEAHALAEQGVVVDDDHAHVQLDDAVSIGGSPGQRPRLDRAGTSGSDPDAKVSRRS
jgi:hypothetical protein